MAIRPWVTPQEVKDYSERDSVKNRSDARLETDIMRAEQWVIAYTRNKFDNADKYLEIPESVKTAVILIAETYASDAAEGKGEFKSESFDDYSYTAADTEYKLANLDLDALLYCYINQEGRFSMRMRKL